MKVQNIIIMVNFIQNSLGWLIIQYYICLYFLFVLLLFYNFDCFFRFLLFSIFLMHFDATGYLLRFIFTMLDDEVF